ncbi:tail fiber protein [Neisseria bacilliformis]|nr:tail fiber protein [Neisseria bacilliformis]
MGKKLADEKADKSWVSQQAQAVRTALKNEILGGAGAAFDTLKEFQTALGDDANFAATTAGKLAEAAPSGMIAYFAGQTAPAGWLKANGVAVSRTAYARLFAAVGTTYGAGDGKTTFNLPDLRGEFLRSWDDARGIDTGRVFGSAQADEFRAHNHVTNINADIPTYGSETGDSVGTEDVSRADDRTVRATTGMRGGAETRPRNIALLACIKI